MSIDPTLNVWEQPGAGDHRRLSRRSEVRAALDRLVRLDPDIAKRATDLRLDEQEWGATGLHYGGTWRETNTPILVKLGVGENELFWTRWLATSTPYLLPTLLASGERLGPPPGLELRWIVTERVPHGCLGPAWQGNEFAMLLDAGVRFQKAARRAPPGHARVVERETMRRWLEQGLALDPPGPTRLLLDRLDEDWAWVTSFCPTETCHGDLHMANALCRTPPPTTGHALLIDPAPAVQPWSFDAAWAQVLNSIDRQRIGYTGLIPRMAALREAAGLQTCRGADLERLAAITLGWFAILVWGLAPGRHVIPDFVIETRRYVEESAGTAEHRPARRLD